MSRPQPGADASQAPVPGTRFLNDRMRAIDGIVVARVNRKVQQTLGTIRLGAAHGRLMAELRPGSRAIELARRLGISKAAVGQLIGTLESEGMVARVPDPEDGRAQLIYPTERASEAYSIARSGLVEVEAEWQELLGLPLFRQLRRALEMLDDWVLASPDPESR